MKAIARYPSHLISNNQFGSSNVSSVIEASMGWIAVGIDRLVAPFKLLTAEDADGAEEFFLVRAEGCLSSVEFPPCSPVSSVVKGFRFFLSSLARLSASHAAFTFPRDAFLLLCHSAESSAPAICAIVFPLSTEVSCASISKPSTTCSSCFLIISHSVPLLPGRRAFMWINAKSPFSRFPCRRHLRSPFLIIAAASASVPGRYFPFTASGERGSHVPTSQTIPVPAPSLPSGMMPSKS